MLRAGSVRQLLTHRVHRCRRLSPSGGTARPSSSDSAAAAGGRRLAVWSFNLRTDFCDTPEVDGLDGWRYRRAGCADLIRRHKPALIAVQEATVSGPRWQSASVADRAALLLTLACPFSDGGMWL